MIGDLITTRVCFHPAAIQKQLPGGQILIKYLSKHQGHGWLHPADLEPGGSHRVLRKAKQQELSL